VQLQETVGPYQVVVVRASMGEALDEWLITNGFVIPPNIQPILDSYVAQKLDFIALKLRPGANVSAMRPVRVIEPGADPTLPLRMISAGAGAHVSITLWVISEGRYEPQNFPMATVDFSKLVYDVGKERSNYAELRAAALAPGAASDAGASDMANQDAGPDGDASASLPILADAADATGGDADAAAGAAPSNDAAPSLDGAGGESGVAMDAATPAVPGYWLTEFAGIANLGSGTMGASAPSVSGTTPALLDMYMKSCVPSTPPNPCDAGARDAGDGDSGDVEAGEAGEASDANDVDAPSEAGADAPLEAEATDSASDGAGSTDAAGGSSTDADVACTPAAPVVCDDPQVAFAGLHTGSIWITRLVADLPYAALGQDLVLQAAQPQSAVDNVHTARAWVDGDPCALGKLGTQSEVISAQSPVRSANSARTTPSCALGPRSPADAIGTVALGGVTALWLVRRKRRRQRDGCPIPR
jgi:hypothetical protein